MNLSVLANMGTLLVLDTHAHVTIVFFSYIGYLMNLIKLDAYLVELI